MKETENLKIFTKGSAGYIELNRPQCANAYTDSMLDEISEAIRDFEQSDTIRSVIIGSVVPGYFCAGADLHAFKSKGVKEALNLKSLATFNAIADLSKITVAAVNGPAIGGGLELMLACDIRVITGKAIFRLPETSMGLIPAAGGIFRLPQSVSKAMTSELILLGRQLNADEALACGLVNYLVEENRLEERINQLAESAEKQDPLAIKLAKRAIGLYTHEDHIRLYSQCAQAILYERKRSNES